MLYLIISSFIWALSFPIIKGYLFDINPILLALIRFFIALLMFTPYAFKKISKAYIFIIVGALQYGLMYVFYLYSFKYLKAYEIAILTTTTPLYIIIINQILNKQKKYYLNAVLVILACSIITYNTFPKSFIGVIYIQISNILFALGQLLYKKYYSWQNIKTTSFYIYLGAILIIMPLLFIFKVDLNIFSIFTNYQTSLAILYLSIIASGFGVYLWNKGIIKTNIKYISILNNLKIPLGVFFSYLILNEELNILNLSIGLLLFMLALL